MAEQSTTYEHGTEPARRVSDEQVGRDLAHAYLWQMTAEDTFLMSAGYPGDLRDARAAIAVERERAEKAERERDEALARASRQDAVNLELFTACKQVADIYGLAMPLHPVDELAAGVRQAKLSADRDLAALRDREQRGGQVTDAMRQSGCAAFAVVKREALALGDDVYEARGISAALEAALAALTARTTAQSSDAADQAAERKASA